MAGRILVVDDVATNRIILKAKLSLACYDVLLAADGRAALAVAAAARPDLILLDLTMPDIDGLQVLRRLKADPETAPIPVIVVTAHADLGSRIAGLRAGAEDVLVKPVEDVVLAARVRSLLRDRPAPGDIEMRDVAPGGDARTEPGDTAPPASAAQDPAQRRPADPPAPAAIGPAGVPAPPANRHDAEARTGLVALVGPDATTVAQWTAALAPLAPLRAMPMTRAEALRLARVDSREARDGAPPGTDRAPHLPDIFVISADLERSDDGLMLLSELRAGAATRHAAILVALPRRQGARGPMALDLGACDLLVAPVAPEEMALRVSAQLTRKRAADARRARLRDGLHLALTDPLTGLGNRRHGLAHLERLEAQRRATGRPYAVLLLDLDRFKQVNDRFGHAAGDAVLRCVAERLAQSLRGSDVVCRYGGEEFVVGLAGADRDGAHAVAERLRAAVARAPIPLPAPAGAAATAAGEIMQTVSIGLAVAPAAEGAPETCTPETGTPETGTPAEAPALSTEAAVETLIAHADRALYAAKSAGRDRVRAAAPAASSSAAA